jgi:hypothetical protein
MWLYRTLFAFDALVVLVLGYFFVDGLQYSGPDALSLWFVILAVPICILVIAEILRGKGKRTGASILLGVAAVPPALFAAFFGLLIALNPSWH